MSRLMVSASVKYVSCGSITEINAVSKFTLSFWANRDVNTKTILCGKQTADANERVDLAIVSNQITYFVLSNGSTAFGFVEDTSVGWHHYAMVFDGTATGNANRLKGYKDGVLQTLDFSGGASIPSQTSSEVVNFALGNATGLTGDGYIGEARIYLDALTAYEVLTDYTGLIPGSSLLDYWKLGVATIEPDWGPGGHVGTLINSPVVGLNPPTRPAWQLGHSFPLVDIAATGTPWHYYAQL